MRVAADQVHVGESVVAPVKRFADRSDAGQAIVDFVSPEPDPAAIVLALPRGGVPVGRPLAEALGCELAPVFVRKLAIPSEPEMGFGAVTVDGTVTLNERIVALFGIDAATIEWVVGETRHEIERRAQTYPGGWPPPALEGRAVWLVDDGLATGYSMLAALDMAAAHRPARLAVAVPCAPDDSLARVASVADEVWSVYAQSGRPFAVASYYGHFPDLGDDEVREALER